MHYRRVRVDPPPAGKTSCAGNNACARCGDLVAAAAWAAGDDAAAQACGAKARHFSSSLFSRRALLEYLHGVLVEVAALQSQSGYDHGAVVKEVHRGGGAGMGPNAGDPVGGPAALLARLDEACGHVEGRTGGNCAEATSLAKWWLSLEPKDYAGARYPLCHKGLCARCCSRG